MADMPDEEPRREALDALVPYFAGATFMAFLRETTALPLKVTDTVADPPNGFYVTLATGETLRISVERVRGGVPKRY